MRETSVMDTSRNRTAQKSEEPLLSLLRVLAMKVVEELCARKQEQAEKKPE
jgi:hypothetical protein